MMDNDSFYQLMDEVDRIKKERQEFEEKEKIRQKKDKINSRFEILDI